MSKQYKVPPLLPIPYIAAMVVAALMPVGAVFYLVSQNKKVDELVTERKKVEEEARAKYEQVSKREVLTTEREQYDNLVKQFYYRFFTEEERGAERIVEEFWRRNIYHGVLGVPEPGRPRSTRKYEVQMPGTAAARFNRSHFDDFGNHFQVEFQITGSTEDLWAFLRDINKMHRELYFPNAVYIEAALPPKILIGEPGDRGKMPLLRDMRTSSRRGLCFDPDSPERPATGPWPGKIWWLGERKEDTMSETDMHEAILLDPGNNDWKARITSLKELIGQPMVSVTSIAPTDASTCPITGLRLYNHAIPLFYYIDKFYVEPSPNNVASKHRIECRLVIPLRKAR